MGNLYVGNSGLQAQQNALNTTAHNMSNMDTIGFVRQQVLFGTNKYTTISKNMSAISNQQVGQGVNYAAARQVRDYFLDQTYRKESGREAFYETSFGSIKEVETVLGELKGEAFKKALDDLWSSVQELHKTPESAVVQGLFVDRSVTFLKRAQAVYDGLNDYQNNLNLQAKQSVDQINVYGRKIKQLNDEIRKIESSGVERANDLRDARNQLIDELGAHAKIEVKEDRDGSVSISLEGVSFVERDTVYEIGLHQDEATGFFTPFWPQNTPFTYNADGSKKYDLSSGKVFNMKLKISSDTNTDIGGLKALLLARGDRKGNYTDLQDKDYYNTNIAQSVIMNVQAQFDQLTRSVVTKLNGILANASEQPKPGGYLCNEDGTPIQIFKRKSGLAWDAPEITNDPSRTETLFSLSNIVMNERLVASPTMLKFIKPDGKVDNETTEKLKNAFQEVNYTLNPNVVKKSNFMDYYSDLVTQVGNTGYVYQSIMVSQQRSVMITENARQGVMGVASEEEMSNMIRFQNGFNAASRYINAVDELLEHIITKLG